MPNGIGIDFGATACRAAICWGEGCEAAPASVTVPGEPPVPVSRRGRNEAQEDPAPEQWLRFETAKANLGASTRLRDAKGSLDGTFEAQTREQLTHLRTNLERHLQARVFGAAVGAPPGYGMNQRAALRSSAKASGFEDIVLIDEPVAAAFAVYQGSQARHRVLVYCLGRSVFSASLLSLEDGVPRPLNHEGLTQLGGQDFDALLVQKLLIWLSTTQGIRAAGDREAMRRLVQCAEQARISLSTEQDATLEVGPVADLAGRPYSTSFRLGRDELERLIDPLVRRTVDLSRKAAGDAAPEVGEILLVGEAARTPLVGLRLREVFGCPLRQAPPDAVARGAALYAATLHECFAAAGANPPVLGLPADEEREPKTAPALPPVDGEDALVAAVCRARQHLQSGKLEGAIVELEGLLGVAREELSYVCSKRASELRQDGRPDDAISLLRRGLQHWPQNAHIRGLLADFHAEAGLKAAREGSYSICKEHLRHCLELAPGNERGMRLANELGRLLNPKGTARNLGRPGGKRRRN